MIYKSRNNRNVVIQRFKHIKAFAEKTEEKNYTVPLYNSTECCVNVGQPMIRKCTTRVEITAMLMVNNNVLRIAAFSAWINLRNPQNLNFTSKNILSVVEEHALALMSN